MKRKLKFQLLENYISIYQILGKCKINFLFAKSQEEILLIENICKRLDTLKKEHEKCFKELKMYDTSFLLLKTQLEEGLQNITIPSIMPSITICLFLSLTNAFKLFDQNLALTAGAPNKKTEMLALNIYNAFYSNATNLGVGQAKAVIFFVLVVAISLTQLYFTRKREVQL